MNVIFSTKSKNQNRYSIRNVEGHGRVFFDKGVKMTTDKDLIRKLISHTLYKRGDYHLVTNPEQVESYLNGETPDKLSSELLDKVSKKGIKELGEILGARNEQPTLIKTEIEGSPITDGVQKVLDFYSQSEEEMQSVEDETQEEVQQEKEVSVFTGLKSTDMNAAEAIEHIEETPIDALDNFVTEDEERKTVNQAWEEKQANN